MRGRQKPSLISRHLRCGLRHEDMYKFRGLVYGNLGRRSTPEEIANLTQYYFWSDRVLEFTMPKPRVDKPPYQFDLKIDYTFRMSRKTASEVRWLLVLYQS